MKTKIVIGIVLAIIVSGGVGIGTLVYLGNKSQQNFTEAIPTASTVPVYFELREQDTNGNFVPTGIDSRYIASTTVYLSDTGMPTGTPYIDINFNDQGKQLLSSVTEQNIGKQVEIFIGGKLVSSPTVMSAITQGSLFIGEDSLTKNVGQSGLTDIENVARSLNAGKGLTRNP